MPKDLQTLQNPPAKHKVSKGTRIQSWSSFPVGFKMNKLHLRCLPSFCSPRCETKGTVYSGHAKEKTENMIISIPHAPFSFIQLHWYCYWKKNVFHFDLYILWFWVGLYIFIPSIIVMHILCHLYIITTRCQCYTYRPRSGRLFISLLSFSYSII